MHRHTITIVGSVSLSGIVRLRKSSNAMIQRSVSTIRLAQMVHRLYPCVKNIIPKTIHKSQTKSSIPITHAGIDVLQVRHFPVCIL